MEIKRSRFKTFVHKTLSLNVLAFSILIAFCALSMIACEDPTNVGLGLVGDDSGQAVTEALNLTSFQAAPEVGIVDNLGQVLVGNVSDPTIGGTSAAGYFDVRTGTSLPAAYRDGTVEKAILRLENSYVYGDTLEEVTLALHEVLSEFTGFGATVDSIPQVGPELLQFTMTPTDSLVSVELPASWVSTHDADLRTTDFNDAFHGFQLVHISGNAVVGFHNAVSRGTSIQGIVGTDTVTYVAEKSITQFTRETESTVPAGRIAIQDGIGPKIAFKFNIDSLQNVALNRVAIRLPIDDAALETPPNFFRPPVETLSLHGVISDSSSILLAIGTATDEGSFDFVSETFHAILQQFLLGIEPYESFEIRFASSPINSINALVLHDIASEAAVPQIFVTYTELN